MNLFFKLFGIKTSFDIPVKESVKKKIITIDKIDALKYS